MVTRFEWTMKHIICFKPEEIGISITSSSQNEVLDFQYVGENSTSELSIKLKNQNSVDVPIKLSLLQVTMRSK